MSDEAGTSQAQGASDAQAQGASSPAQGATAPAHGASGEQSGSVSVEALIAKLSALEKDNLSYRERERQREEAERKRTKAELTEAERMSVRVAELEQALAERTKREQEQSLRLASITAAQKLGYRNADLAPRLLDPAQIKYGEDGVPQNVEALLSELAKSDPYLLSATDFGGGQRGSSAAQGSDMNTLIRRAVGRS